MNANRKTFLCLVSGAALVASLSPLPSPAEPIDLSPDGLADPESTITFDEIAIDDSAEVTTQFAGLGVTLVPNLFLRVGDNPDWQHIEGPNLRTGDPEVNPFTIRFGNPLTSAAFVAIAQPPTPATITAKLNGVEVESFETTVSIDNPDNFFGFTDITFNEIEVAYEAETRLRIDNVQLGLPAEVQDPLADGLVGYWPLDGSTDDVIGGYHGEAMGSEPLTYDAGKLGGAGVDLDGVDQFIQISGDEDVFDFGAPDEPTGFTISAWYRVDAFTKSWQCLVAKGEGNRWRVHRRGADAPAVFAANGGNADVPAYDGTEYPIDDGEYHHVVVVSVPEDRVELWLDGDLVSTGPAPALENGANPMMIGENPDALGRTWDGGVDDVAAWNRPLSEDEVKRVWNEGGKGKSLGDLLSPSTGIEVVHGKQEILDEGSPDGWDLTVFVVNPLLTSEGTDAEGTPDGTVTSWSVAFREDRADGAHTAAPVLAKRDTDSGEIVVVGVGDVVTPEEGGVFTLPWGVGTGSNTIDISEANTQWLMGLYQGGPNGDDAGAVVPFAAGEQYPMFGWNTADLPPEPDEVVAPGHASFDAPDLREYQFNFTVSWGGGVSNDLDGDGLPNFYEEANGLNPNDPADAASDSDNDGLTALQEFERKTDPNKADTDGDGLSDKVETNTGIWVSAEDTGTNPRKDDSDNDGLKDGVETNTKTFVSDTNTGTDPNLKDSDGDKVNDGTEVAAGTDPTNPAVFPGCETPILNGGSIAEILGPDDLHLDPSSVLIAVDVYGDQIEEGRNVNGVTFFSDRCDDCADTEGMLEVGGVTYRAESTNFIDGWAAPPDFTGGQGASAEELAGIMEDIRWSAAPSSLTVDIEGLDPGAAVEVQMLFNEGGDRNRRWDIGVEGELAVDDFTSEGCRGDSGGVWSPENSFLYTFEAMPSADGILNIELQQDLGGEPSPGGDNNPILQGVIVHRAGAGVPFEITDITASPEQIVLSWNSLPDRDYAVEFTADLSSPVWIEVDDGVASEGTTTSFTDDDPARIGLPEGYYRVRN